LQIQTFGGILGSGGNSDGKKAVRGMKYQYSMAKVGDLDIHYELADYPHPWRDSRRRS
jgi:hypothetical protein